MSNVRLCRAHPGRTHTHQKGHTHTKKKKIAYIQEDLRAIFAFAAHTPEGHEVEKIGVIADAMCGRYKTIRFVCSNLRVVMCVE